MIPMSLRIRRARTQARLTQSEIARRLSVQRSAVTQWERESGTTPSVAHLAQIACETNVFFEWLATGRGPMRPDDDVFVDAVVAQDFARDEFESRALVAIRRMRHNREPVVKLLEMFSS